MALTQENSPPALSDQQSSPSALADQQYSLYGSLYESDLFIESIGEEFKCAICLCILKDPHQLSSCEHLFCRVCITTHFQTSQANNCCPIDRISATVDSIRPAPRVVRNLIDQLLVKCPNHSDGCTHVMRLELLDRHDRICSFGPCAPHSDQTVSNPRDVATVEVNALPITIYVKLADTSKTAVITASAEDNVLTLKRRIKDKEGIDTNGLALTHGTKPLSDDRKLLIEYNIKNGSVIFSSRRFNGGFIAILIA